MSLYIIKCNVFLLYKVSHVELSRPSMPILRITDDILSRSECMILVSSSELMKYRRKHFSASLH